MNRMNICNVRRGIGAMLIAGWSCAPVLAQTAPTTATPATVPAAVSISAPTATAAVPNARTINAKGASAKGAIAKGRECTRLPLTDIQVGKEKTIEVARLRLDEYMAKVGKQRAWKSWDKSLETVSCDDYLNVPFLGQEYKCMVTATFCRKS